MEEFVVDIGPSQAGLDDTVLNCILNIINSTFLVVIPNFWFLKNEIKITLFLKYSVYISRKMFRNNVISKSELL